MTVAHLQSAASLKLIAFESADVVPGIAPDSYFLIVTGEAPCLNMHVELAPMIYIECPDYWGIEVTGALKGGFCLEAVKPFHVVIPLTGITGRKGIEVIGGNRRQTFDVAGGCN